MPNTCFFWRVIYLMRGEKQCSLCVMRSTARRLTSWKAIIGYIIVLLVILNSTVGAIANIDFAITASGNPRLVALWNFFASPKGNLVAILCVAIWITILVLWPEKNAAATVAKESSEKANTEQEEKPAQTAPPIKGQTKVIQAEEPNLVCQGVQHVPVHDRHGIWVEGQLPRQYGVSTPPDVLAVVANICNEFSSSRKVGSVANMTAEMIYKSSDGVMAKVNRGAWLSDGNRIHLTVNDTGQLILAGIFGGSETVTFIMMRDYDRDNILNSMGRLEGDVHHLEVRLISEEKGILYTTFEFTITITREPELDIEVVQVKELSPKEIRQQLELFLAEGSEILRDFPREKQAKPEDIAKVDDWEKRAVRFLGRCPDQFSTALFLSDFPEVPVAGGAQGGNWPSLKKLSRRLATLRQFIDEIRRG